MNLKQYLMENQGENIKKEIKKLEFSKKQGKLTAAGERRLEKLEDMLHRLGIFDY